MAEASFIGDDAVRERLDSLVNPWFVLGGLFNTALRVSRERCFLAVVDLERNYDVGADGVTRKYIASGSFRAMAIQQFSQYVSDIGEELPAGLRTARNLHFLVRLQLSAYIQLWESHGIQRLLKSIADVASGKVYDPEIFLDQEPRKSFENWESIKRVSKVVAPYLAKEIDALYYNRVRNAIAHSEFYIIDEWLAIGDPLEEAQKRPERKKGPNAKRQGWIKLDTWEKLYGCSIDFFGAISAMRRNMERKLLELQPLTVALEEFQKPFVLKRDGRGHWVMSDP